MLISKMFLSKFFKKVSIMKNVRSIIYCFFAVLFTACMFSSCNKDVEDGKDGKDGKDGADGKSGSELTIVDCIWYIDGKSTDINACGTQGEPGEQGESGEQGAQGAQGGQGEPGTPGSVVYIGENGNWWIDDFDTEIKAEGPQGEVGPQGPQGPQGKPGSVVYIGDNGNWWIDDDDTGVRAAGSVVTIGPNGNWWIDGEDTEVSAIASNPLTDFSISDDAIDVQVSKTKTVTITAYVPAYPNDLTAPEWLSLDTDVATVVNGVITGVSDGTTTVTCTINGITKDIEVEVWTTKPFMGPHVITLDEPYYLDIWKFDIGGPGISYFRGADANSIFVDAAKALRESGGDAYFTQPHPEIDLRNAIPQIGGNQPDNWHLFTVEVQDAGDYKVEIEYSCSYSPPGKIHLEVDGVKATETVDVFSTGDWNNFTTLKIGTVTLTAGTHKVKFYIETTGINTRGLIFSEDTDEPEPEESQPFMGPHNLSSTPLYLEIWKFDIGGNGVGYFETTNANIGPGATLRASDPTYTSPPYVQLEGAAPPYNTGGNQATEWQLFTVEVLEAGDYKAEVEFSCGYASPGQIHLEVDGVNVTGTVTVVNTGNWANFQFIEVGTLTLTAGTHKIKFYIELVGINVRGLQFTKL